MYIYIYDIYYCACTSVCFVCFVCPPSISTEWCQCLVGLFAPVSRPKSWHCFTMFQDVSRKVKQPAGPSTFCFVHGRRILWHIQIRFLSIYLLQIITSSTTTIHCSNELPHCIVLPCPICLLAPDDMVFFWYWFLFVFWFEMILNLPTSICHVLGTLVVGTMWTWREWLTLFKN